MQVKTNNIPVKKITTLKGAADFSRNECSKGKKVGLVVGSFDILHLGHINLFSFAKKHVDYLLVGLDNDETIRLVKGENRPINNYKQRAKLLSNIVTIDKIFRIDKTSHHDSEEALKSYKELVDQIQPTHIFTHKTCDQHWLNKSRIAKGKNITFLSDMSKKITNSGTILAKLSSEL